MTSSTSSHNTTGANSSRRLVLPHSVQANLFAQKLNNSAVLCIEIGQYDRAMASLAKALRLLEFHSDGRMEDACLCQDCTLDGCISYSENNAPPLVVASVPTTTTTTTASSSPQPPSSSTASNSSTPSPTIQGHFWTPPTQTCYQEEEDDDDDDNRGSIYRRPIRINPRCILEGHFMGSTLFLIITFNLAMVHHLSAVTASSKEACRAKLENTLKLYELANSWLHRHSNNCRSEQEEDVEDYEDDNDADGMMSVSSSESDDYYSDDYFEQERGEQQQQQQQPYHSIRFNMIIWNNLSHIHRSVRDHEKHQQCLQHLLSIVMLVVDHIKVVQQNNHNAIADDVYCDGDEGYSLRSMDLEGFVQNTSLLMFQDNCADAA